MRINLLSDAPRHNLALMRISAYHKANGDIVTLNQPLEPCEKSYGSWLFSHRYACDLSGGPAFSPKARLDACFDVMPDYDLYSIDYSLGSTWDYCPRKCGFCIVPEQDNPRRHRSIWSFHNQKFRKICLLNNNTFSDPCWRETFEEIWEANLTVVDENGYDLRLLDEEKAEALKRTKFEKQIHFAWDQMADEANIRRGIQCLFKAGVKPYRIMCYILVGFDSTFEADTYRFKILTGLHIDPFVMIFNNKRSNQQLRDFARWVNKRIYKSCDWEHYKYKP